MSCLGVHIALTEEQRRKLEGLESPFDKIDHVQEELMENWDEDYFQETDKAWDAIHRCLGEFPPDTEWFYKMRPELGPYALPENHGSYPLRWCILGGRRLVPDELPDTSHYFMRLIEPHEVIDIAKALPAIDKPWMWTRYVRHCKGAWPEYGEEDFEFMWEWFQPLRDYFTRMAGNGRSIIFTADQ